MEVSNICGECYQSDGRHLGGCPFAPELEVIGRCTGCGTDVHKGDNRVETNYFGETEIVHDNTGCLTRWCDKHTGAFADDRYDDYDLDYARSLGEVVYG